jgi:hypothetical protein
MENFPISQSETKEQRMKRMMGLRDFPKKTSEEKMSVLGNEQRLIVLDAIDTTTYPRSKREVKKGIVLEVADKVLISDEILRNHPVVYIGSGTDIEYPLALGGRIIVMVDPLLGHEEARKELLEKVQKYSGANLVESDNGIIDFPFDFGSGEESVKVELAAVHYPYQENLRKEDDYQLPQDIGVVILYAPAGVIVDEGEVKEKLTEGGAIINEYTLTTKDGKSVDLGS